RAVTPAAVPPPPAPPAVTVVLPGLGTVRPPQPATAGAAPVLKPTPPAVAFVPTQWPQPGVRRGGDFRPVLVTPPWVAVEWTLSGAVVSATGTPGRTVPHAGAGVGTANTWPVPVPVPATDWLTCPVPNPVRKRRPQPAGSGRSFYLAPLPAGVVLAGTWGRDVRAGVWGLDMASEVQVFDPPVYTTSRAVVRLEPADDTAVGTNLTLYAGKSNEVPETLTKTLSSPVDPLATDGRAIVIPFSPTDLASLYTATAGGRAYCELWDANYPDPVAIFTFRVRRSVRGVSP
ncbi:MAG: hypothetical protein K2X82_30180, partial [Gemmataceae bacterium]|nr:hypothetical protein [Gemmataceae bacterium]